MFTNDQLTNALDAYGTSASAHVSRLIALADMREVENATIDYIAVAVRHAAACRELGVPFDDSGAAAKRAAERMPGYSESTFQRYNTVLDWLATSLSDDETLTDVLASDTFTADALSALCQLASGKVAPRKVASDTVAKHISKRDSAKVVTAYRRLLAASNAKAKAKAKRERATRTATATATATEDATATARTAEDILAELTIPAMAELLLSRIARDAEELTADDYASLVDTLAAIGAMIEETADN